MSYHFSLCKSVIKLIVLQHILKNQVEGDAEEKKINRQGQVRVDGDQEMAKEVIMLSQREKRPREGNL